METQTPFECYNSHSQLMPNVLKHSLFVIKDSNVCKFVVFFRKPLEQYKTALALLYRAVMLAKSVAICSEFMTNVLEQKFLLVLN